MKLSKQVYVQFYNLAVIGEEAIDLNFHVGCLRIDGCWTPRPGPGDKLLGHKVPVSVG